MFRISGLITPPCGTPCVVGVNPTRPRPPRPSASRRSSLAPGTSQRREKTIMIDGVERAGQVRVENPHPCAATGQGVEQRLDRVVTAAARPKPGRAGLEAGLPLRLQRLA